MLEKYPKDARLYKAIRKTITKDKRLHDFTDKEAANELGLEWGTLDNKLKPSVVTNDLHLMEYLHLIDNTADFTTLDMINSRYGRTYVNMGSESNTTLNKLFDIAMIEATDVFSCGKAALEDGKMSGEEAQKAYVEIDEAVEWLLTLKKQIKRSVDKNGGE